MAFAETFKDLRMRRRIPMRFFEEKVGIHPSYIYGIEKEGTLPGPEKLEQLASVFVSVAAEQRAADPEDDARYLRRERERTVFQDLGVDPNLVEILLVLREIDAQDRADLLNPLRDSLATFLIISRQERGGLAKLLKRIRSIVESSDEISRSPVVSNLATEVEKSLDAVEAFLKAAAPQAADPRPSAAGREAS